MASQRRLRQVLRVGLSSTDVAVAGSSVEFVVICTGRPHGGMGWYHSKQLLDGEIVGAHLGAVVEPWFLGGGADSEQAADFRRFRQDAEQNHGVTFVRTVEELPAATGPRVALIAARAEDFPPLFHAALAAGADHIYLEKPGAPDVASMEAMVVAAEQAGVPVSMGFNKNVAKYTEAARDYERAHPGSSTTFLHNNPYTEATLDECFERNSNVHNMIIHELALLTTFYGVTASNISRVVADTSFSLLETRGDYTDFTRLAFTVTTDAGGEVSVKADRCGGNNSQAVVTPPDGGEQFRSIMPDAELEDPATNDGGFGYFFTQHDDYVTIKQRIADSIRAPETTTVPEGVASIAVGLETLKVAEYLLTTLREQLL